MSGSVSRSKNDPSQSLQMIERPLLTPDELKSLPKGDFIVMKTGVHPMWVHLKLFFKWGIEFNDEHPYTVPNQGTREVRYADKKEIQNGILENIRRSGKRKRLHRATLTAAVRCNRPAPRTSRRERSRKIRTEAATPSVPHRRKKKLLPT